jgi:O-antigen/teichoic acid export membrane protein
VVRWFLEKGRLFNSLRVSSTSLSRILSSQSTWLGIIDQAIVGATGFATSVIVGRGGSKEELGSYYLMLSVLVFARLVQEGATGVPYTVYWSRRAQERRASYTGSCLSHQLIVAILTSIGFLGLAVAATLGLATRELIHSAAVLIVFGPAVLLKEYLRRLSFAHMNMAAAIQLDITVALVQVLGLVLIVIAGMLSAGSAYLVIGLACTVASIAWFRGDHIAFRFAWGEIGEDWKWNWRIGKWAVAGQVTGSIVLTLIPWALGYFHGLGETGLLGAGYALVGPCNILVIGVTNILAPRAIKAFIEDGQAALWITLRNTSAGLAVGLASFLAVSLLFGEFLAVLLFGPQFGRAGAIMATLALALLINAQAMTAGTGLYALEQTRVNFVVDLIATILAVCAAVLLIGPFGADGAAAATVVAAAVGAIGKYMVLIRLIRSGSATAPQA